MREVCKLGGARGTHRSMKPSPLTGLCLLVAVVACDGRSHPVGAGGNPDGSSGAGGAGGSGGAGGRGGSGGGGMGGAGGAPDAGGPGGAGGSLPPPQQHPAGVYWIHRLTDAEYRHTIRDLLGEALPPPPLGRLANRHPADDSPFPAGAWVTASHDARQLMELAERVAASAVQRLPALLPVGCFPTPAAPSDEEACVRRFLEGFALRAFRRPLPVAEIEDLVLQHRELRAAPMSAPFADALRVVIATILQMPDFLYRGEVGDGGGGMRDGPLLRLGHYQMASRLSYFAWSSMPDAELFRAASAGELHDPGKVVTQLRRLLEDPRARDAVRDFHVQWLDLDYLAELSKHPMLYPRWTPEIARLLLAETGDFAASVLLGPTADGKIETLFTSTRTIIDPRLGSIYDRPDLLAASGPQAVTLDPARRSGLLTQGAFLARHASEMADHPIFRGITVLNRILCVPIVPPVDVDIPILPDPMPNQTTRQRVEAATRVHPACRSCHEMVDPLGFAFSHYDAIGAYRTTDGGLPIDASGKVTVEAETFQFANAIELTRQLGQSRQVRNCMARRWTQWALRRADTESERQTIVPLGVHTDWRAIVVELTRLRAFTHRSPSPGEPLP